MKNLLDSRLLSLFLEVGEVLNFSEAARRLGISQPALSTQIQKLEETLGVVLFDRSTRPLRLTAAGRYLFREGVWAIRNLEELNSGLSSFKGCRKTPLRLAATTSVSESLLPFVVNGLVQEASLENIMLADTLPGCERLLRDDVDIAVASRSLREYPEVSSIRLYSERYVIVVPPSFEEPVVNLPSLQRLTERFPYVGTLGQGTVDAINAERIIRHLGIRLTRPVQVDSPSVITSLVAGNSGWMIAPIINIWFVRGWLGQAKIYPVFQTLARRDMYVLWKDDQFSALAARIAELLRTAVSGHILPWLMMVTEKGSAPLVTICSDEAGVE